MMCLLVPGRIISIENNEATVDYNSEKRKGMILDGGYEVGDYVLVQGGFVVLKVDEKEALRALDLYNSSQDS